MIQPEFCARVEAGDGMNQQVAGTYGEMIRCPQSQIEVEIINTITRSNRRRFHAD
jgi:hypothetical protein